MPHLPYEGEVSYSAKIDELAEDEGDDYELELEKPDTNRKMMLSPSNMESSRLPNTTSKDHYTETEEADKSWS